MTWRVSLADSGSARFSVSMVCPVWSQLSKSICTHTVLGRAPSTRMFIPQHSSRQSAIHQDVHTSTKFRAERHPPGCSYTSHKVQGRAPSFLLAGIALQEVLLLPSLSPIFLRAHSRSFGRSLSRVLISTLKGSSPNPDHGTIHKHSSGYRTDRSCHRNQNATSRSLHRSFYRAPPHSLSAGLRAQNRRGLDCDRAPRRPMGAPSR